MRSLLSLCVLTAAIVTSCSTTSDVGLPILTRGKAFEPIEGLESTDLAARAHGAVLSGSGDSPISVTLLPSRSQHDHPIRGMLLALAGPTPDGRFAFAVQDERDGYPISIGDVRGGDRFALRFRRPMVAMSIAPDAAHLAILTPFDEDDARSEGGQLRELVVVDVKTGKVQSTGIGCWSSTPAWIDKDTIACITPTPDSAASVEASAKTDANEDEEDEEAPRSIALVKLGGTLTVRHFATGDAVLADDSPSALLAFRRTERGLTAVRIELETRAEKPLKLRGALQPLSDMGDDLIASFSAPTLGTEPQWQLELLGPQVGLATIKLHDLATGDFQTIDPRASPRRLWSAGRLKP